VDQGDIAISRWFGTIRGSVHIDSSENGVRDPGEPRLPNQDLDTRFKDATIQYATFTDANGNYVFPEVFEGKKPFGPGENGGIVGIVFDASTRNKLDAALQAAEGYEPGVPGVTVNLYAPVLGANGQSMYDPNSGEVLKDHLANVYATDGCITTHDGNSVYMWSYAADDGEEGTKFQYPGPTLCVKRGDKVVVHLANDLPEDVSILFTDLEDIRVGPNPRFSPLAQPQFDASGNLTSLTNSAPPGGSITYSFVASEPGTYIYQSGTNPHT